MDEPKLDVAYVEMTEPQAHASYGKMKAGKVYAVETAQAASFIRVGVAKESNESAFNKQRDERKEKIQDRNSRAGDFDALNQESSDAAWDVSTHRDVTMAPEEGIRRAFEKGRLVNTSRLLDEDGVPLTGDASLDEILAARKRLDGAAVDSLTDHTRSSVQGGGPHTQRPADPTVRNQEFSTLDGIAPLNANTAKLTPEQLGNGSTLDTGEDSDDDPPKQRGRLKK